MADRNQTVFRRYNTPTTREGMYLRLPPSDFFPQGDVPAVIDPFRTTVSQEYPLGTELFYADRKFRYARNGAVALTIAKLCQAVVPLAGHISEAINEPAVGSNTIAFTPAVVTTDDLAVDQLADGYIFVESATSGGHAYRIKSHPAIVGAVSGVLTLYDPILVAPAAAALATVVHNRWRNVIVHPSPPTALLAGVTVLAVPANEYCWLQTKGPCPVLLDGTVVINTAVMPSAVTDGSVADWTFTLTEGAPNTITNQARKQVGYVMVVTPTTDYGLIWLDLGD